MNTNWDQLIENHFEKKNNRMSIDFLIESVQEVLGELEAIDPILLEAPQSGPKAVTFSYSAIPTMPMNELGWASLESNDKPSQDARKQLEQFMDQVKGADLKVKLNYLSKILNDPEHAQELISYGATDKSKIASTLSYLIFFKTLTEVITNFNAASAGFNFEAFLAVLLGGEQIPAQGADTIADIRVGNIPMSLKLYQEKTLKAGGSYPALVGDMIKKPFLMQYVVVAKELSGEGTSRSGGLTFYRYNFTSDNIVNILYKSVSPENSDLIRLPKSIVAGQRRLDFRIPKLIPFNKIKDRFEDNIRAELGDVGYADEVLGIIDYGSEKKHFNGNKPGRGRYKTLNTVSLKQTVDEVREFLKTQNLGVTPEEVLIMMVRANDEAIKVNKSAQDKIDKIRAGADDFATPEESLQYFNSLDTPSRRRALMFTSGLRGRGAQYELRKADIREIQNLAVTGADAEGGTTGFNVFPSGQTEAIIGTLQIGQDRIEQMLNELVNDINRSVFEIFENVKTLSDNLQSYFAHAMNDNTEAETAISAANNIQVKTKEVQEIE